jgi:hypothetical protein
MNDIVDFCSFLRSVRGKFVVIVEEKKVVLHMYERKNDNLIFIYSEVSILKGFFFHVCTPGT